MNKTVKVSSINFKGLQLYWRLLEFQETESFAEVLCDVESMLVKA